jgi:hypothetical protein
MAILIRTSDVPAAQRHEAWRSVVCDTLGPLDMRSDPDTPLHGEIEAGQLGPVSVGRVKTSTPHSVYRTPGLIRRDSPELYRVALAMSGTVEGRTGDGILVGGDVDAVRVGAQQGLVPEAGAARVRGGAGGAVVGGGEAVYGPRAGRIGRLADRHVLHGGISEGAGRRVDGELQDREEVVVGRDMLAGAVNAAAAEQQQAGGASTWC